MLQTISGTITAVDNGLVTIDTGLLGFGITVPSTVQSVIGQKIKLFIHMHWHAEQGPSLYGFANELDKAVFQLVIDCSGIGPKIAMAVLGQLGSAAFIQAVQQSDQQVLSKISGVGAKKAEQIIVHLKHKVSKLIASGVPLEGAEQVMHWHNVSEVLNSLNYSRPEVNQALSWLKEQNQGVEVPFDKLVRQALSFLAKRA